MSKTNKIVSTALAKLNDGSAMAKKAWKNSDLASKASALVGAGAGLAALKKGGSAAVKTVRKHPVGAAVTAATLAAVGAAVYMVNKKKKASAAKPAAKKASKQIAAKKSAAPAKKAAVKKAAAKKAPAKKAAAKKAPAKKAAAKK
jgi:hypothetical protein